MNIRERHEELLQKVRTGEPMSQDEIREAERLGKTLSEIDREFAQSLKQVQENSTWVHIFNENIPGLGKLADTIGNRGRIESWFEDDELKGKNVVFSVPWFVEKLKSEPQLVQEVQPWVIPLTAKQREAKADRLRQIALRLCHEENLSECESNIQLLSGSLDESNGLLSNNGTIVWANNTPFLFSDTGEFELVPASEQELAKYGQERIKAKNQKLRKLAAKNDIAGLKAIQQQERVEKQESFETKRQQDFLGSLAVQVERDQQAGYTTPLPSHITSETIKGLYSNPAQLRQLMKRYGPGRVTARLHQITEVPNGRGGTYKFEE